ncbi:MAG TPA: D-alanyl-D-alanine carboxypeptidase/D-alanyl-D-alanine-endopeptidase [Noviherbaspirillum sp.]|nr:D-alanyl-D-alanine carboxypeptidase/D-alanyl-D-alanine-endopeptidase [Noviherbaspirillum sp.]HJV86563.1 D-alanyl-D-alanine carboxypeptidase/D-alanyl-D-alanine-endopeptidase [Noviherbaspirillum sp.]
MPIPVADALQRAQIPASATGIYVREVGAGPLLLASNESMPFNPASTMKLVTSDAALELLGPSFTWRTQAYVTGAQVGDVLRGDLYIKGSGDPKLVLENFWLFLRRIRARGIREIRGDLVLDRSAFEEMPYDPSQFDGDPMKPYNVGPDALLLNYKALAFRFTPDEARGAVGVTMDPALAAYPVMAPRLAHGECGDWHARLRPVIDTWGARFAGTYSASCGEKVWYVNPYQMTHTQYFHLAFRRLWADLGGTLKGDVKNGAVPDSARLVAQWDSPALAEVIRDINKYSNNVMARQLLLTIAANELNLPANPERGAAVLRTWLGKKGIDAPELSVENGSGLSRTERISPLTMGRMLEAAFQSPVMPEFMASLPLAGLDGTMRMRLVNQTVAGKAHIKTGLLNEVRNIAGYVQAASGKRYVVVFMINHPNSLQGQEAQDALLQWVYEHG